MAFKIIAGDGSVLEQRETREQAEARALDISRDDWLVGVIWGSHVSLFHSGRFAGHLDRETFREVFSSP